jgi:hypothetical protein
VPIGFQFLSEKFPQHLLPVINCLESIRKNVASAVLFDAKNDG